MIKNIMIVTFSIFSISIHSSALKEILVKSIEVPKYEINMINENKLELEEAIINVNFDSNPSCTSFKQTIVLDIEIDSILKLRCESSKIKPLSKNEFHNKLLQLRNLKEKPVLIL